MHNDQITNVSTLHLADAPQSEPPTDVRRRRLKELADLLNQCHPFRKGQFVQWKPGLKNRTAPDYGEPAIVMAVLPTPVFDPGENAATASHLHEPLTLVIATCRGDDLLEFLVDRRRFEPA
ncbi:hypothetical protein [Methylocella sp.]|uniref:hypothetical protein n=1 Tax=Methylocella sp. TaxID=1978226 RepID=UPI003784F36C